MGLDGDFLSVGVNDDFMRNGAQTEQVADAGRGGRWQEEEYADADQQGDSDRRPADGTVEADVLFFIQGDVSRPHQGADAQPERVPQADQTTQKGSLGDAPAVEARAQGLLVDDDFAFGIACSHRHRVRPAHHHTLYDSLAAVREF